MFESFGRLVWWEVWLIVLFWICLPSTVSCCLLPSPVPSIAVSFYPIIANDNMLWRLPVCINYIFFHFNFLGAYSNHKSARLLKRFTLGISSPEITEAGIHERYDFSCSLLLIKECIAPVSPRVYFFPTRISQNPYAARPCPRQTKDDFCKLCLH